MPNIGFNVAGEKGNTPSPDINNNNQVNNNGNTPAADEAAGAAIMEKKKQELDAQYIDTKSVTISLSHRYSLYRQVNSKTLPKRHDVIGSSYNSSVILTSNKEEMEAYMPPIIGISPTNEEFVTRVKAYFNNFAVVVDELGKKLNVSFRYNHYRDYLDIKSKENEILARYDAADKHDIKSLKEALAEKISDLNALESTKYKYGNPVNVTDYILYRHCLLYSGIAKDVSLINSDPSIRFYIKDDKREAENEAKFRNAKNLARANYVKLLNDAELFKAVFIDYCTKSNIPISSGLAMDIIKKQELLDTYSTNEPVKFNRACEDKDIVLKGLIETLIAKGELIRATYNQNISTASGEFIGANLKEAVTWFKSPANNAMVENFKNRLIYG